MVRKYGIKILFLSDSCNRKNDNLLGCWLSYLILEVRDNGIYPLTIYRRVLIQTTNQTISE